MSASTVGRKSLARARRDYRDGLVQSAWFAVERAAEIARSTDDPLLLADAALVITEPPTAAWAFSSQRQKLCHEALAALRDRDPERADRLRALLEAGSTSGLRALDDPGGSLTRREHDIARLVANGMTNRQIAARLFLSERTVENHVSHILRKLGSATRAGIAVRLPRSGLSERGTG
jgi:DNA-binding CsgD family transcriptional regulator